MGRRLSIREDFVRVKTLMDIRAVWSWNISPATTSLPDLTIFSFGKSKSAENRAAGSLWMVHHRYMRILCVSKPLWANNAHKVEPNTGPIKNLIKSLLILRSPKTNLKVTFLIFKSSPIVPFLQDYRAIGGCYWTKIAKKMNMYYKRNRQKISKNWHFCKKTT